MKMRIELEWDAYTGKPVGHRIGVTIGSNEKLINTFPNNAHHAVIYMHVEANVLHQFWVQAFDAAGNVSPKTYIKNAYAPSTM